jgi:hypothetical protein
MWHGFGNSNGGALRVILFLGAQFTQVYARTSGAPIEPTNMQFL